MPITTTDIKLTRGLIRFGETRMKLRVLGLRILGCLAIAAGFSNFAAASADAATIVALGASNTYGKGVARNQAFPAQLEAILRTKRSNRPCSERRYQR